MRAYTAKRGSSEIDETLIGSVAFYNASVDDFLLLVGRTDLGRTPWQLTITAGLLTCCAALGVPLAVYITYGQLGVDQSGVQYIIKGLMIVLLFAVPAAVAYDLWNLLMINVSTPWLKFSIIIAGTIAGIFGFISAFFIVCTKNCHGICMSRHPCLSLLVQSLSIGLLIFFSELLALHGMFNIMFLLLIASPQHITVSVVFYGTGFFSCVVMAALMILLLDDYCCRGCTIVDRNDSNNSTAHNDAEGGNSHTGTHTKSCNCLGASYIMLFSTVVFLFLLSFIYCFSEFTSFVNSSSSESYIATLTPSVILAIVGIFLTYIIKRKTLLDTAAAIV